jgi:nucleoside-diphosphate-sugar epimerase
MKVLLTGATGFLGKNLLELLLTDPRVERIWVVSRNKRTHPSPKVKVLRLDLSDPAQIFNFEASPDAVIHLAGLYSFEQGYESCYTQNLVPALHLSMKLREWNKQKRIPLYFASTYAVTFGQEQSAAEEPLTQLPTTQIPYAYTKALAERAITDSGIPCAIFRLGVLVGKTTDGSFDKLDGAYSFVHLIDSVRPFIRWMKRIPLPGKPDGVLPLVPVDTAAKVFHEALFRENAAAAPARIYGVYDTQSISIREFSDSVLAHYAPGSQGFFIQRVPRLFLEAQSRLTPVSADAFQFALNPVKLENESFQETFPSIQIPHFSSYESAFFSGYRLMTRGSA